MTKSDEKIKPFLEHYGVKGMRWGVRRRSASVPKYSDEGAEARLILKKKKDYGIGSLTNHELRVVNSRIKLEQEFHKMNPKPKGKIQKGIDYVDKASKVYESVEKMDKIFKSVSGRAKIAKGKAIMNANPKAPASTQ